MWSSLSEFVQWFARSVINPMLDMLRNVPIFDHTLFDWFMGLGLLSLAVAFYRWFWGSGSTKD